MFITGEADGLIRYEGAVTGERYAWGQEEGVSYLAQRYGCRQQPTTTYLGTSGSIKRDVYAGCAKRFRAVGLISVPQAGHAYNVDGVQGFNSEASLWNFWASQ